MEKRVRMSTAQLRVEEYAWTGQPRSKGRWSAAENRRRHLLAGLVGLSLIAADVVLVAGGVLLAYVARFSVDDSLPSLALDGYIRLAVLQGLLTSVLLATHG